MIENGWGKERKINRELATPILMAGGGGGGVWCKTFFKWTIPYIIFYSRILSVHHSARYLRLLGCKYSHLVDSKMRLQIGWVIMAYTVHCVNSMPTGSTSHSLSFCLYLLCTVFILPYSLQIIFCLISCSFACKISWFMFFCMQNVMICFNVNISEFNPWICYFADTYLLPDSL